MAGYRSLSLFLRLRMDDIISININTFFCFPAHTMEQRLPYTYAAIPMEETLANLTCVKYSVAAYPDTETMRWSPRGSDGASRCHLINPVKTTTARTDTKKKAAVPHDTVV